MLTKKKEGECGYEETVAGQELNSPNISERCVNRGSCLDCLVLHYVSNREAHNHTPTVPQSVAIFDKYVAHTGDRLSFNLILQQPYISCKSDHKYLILFSAYIKLNGNQVVVFAV